jgi:hypothetical protein
MWSQIKLKELQKMSELSVSQPPVVEDKPQELKKEPQKSQKKKSGEGLELDSERKKVKEEILLLARAYGLSMEDFLPEEKRNILADQKESKKKNLDVPVEVEQAPKIPAVVKGAGQSETKPATRELRRIRGMNNEEKKLLPLLREYCHKHTIALLLKGLCESVPEALPNYTTWDAPDIVPLIYDKIQEVGHVESLWPTLRMLLKDNLRNVTWTARVIVCMTIFIVAWDIAPDQKCNEVTR